MKYVELATTGHAGCVSILDKTENPSEHSCHLPPTEGEDAGK